MFILRKIMILQKCRDLGLPFDASQPIKSHQTNPMKQHPPRFFPCLTHACRVLARQAAPDPHSNLHPAR